MKQVAYSFEFDGFGAAPAADGDFVPPSLPPGCELPDDGP